MKINDRIQVKYIGDFYKVSLKKNKVYEARILQRNWYGIVDETGEEYAFPPQLFEVVGRASERNKGKKF